MKRLAAAAAAAAATAAVGTCEISDTPGRTIKHNGLSCIQTMGHKPRRPDGNIYSLSMGARRAGLATLWRTP
jgi:hypothetical protein